MSNDLSQPLPVAPSHDWLLETLVRTVNGTNEKIPVTLLIDGFVVCGDLVGGNVYFQHMLETHFSHQNNDDDLFTRQMKETIEYYSDESAQVSFAHLFSVKFYHPNRQGAMPVDNDQEFRIRLEKVSGFHIGRYIFDGDDEESELTAISHEE